MKSRLLTPESYEEWRASLAQVGYDGVVGSVVPLSYIQEVVDGDWHKRSELIKKAATDVAHLALGNAFKDLHWERIEARKWGLHLDISGDYDYGSGVPELSFWFNQTGVARWTLIDTGSRDKDEINQAVERVQMEVPSSVADNGLVIHPDYLHECAQITFGGFGMLAFAAGLQADGSRNPSAHMIETMSSSAISEERVSFAIYGRRTA